MVCDAYIVWNRACGATPVGARSGDRALASLLRAHGFAMNGGVLHAVECLSASELSDAQAGYRFYGYDAVASILSSARALLEAGDDLEFHETELDGLYAQIIPDDSSLVARFEKHFREHPAEYVPVRAEDRV